MVVVVRVSGCRGGQCECVMYMVAVVKGEQGRFMGAHRVHLSLAPAVREYDSRSTVCVCLLRVYIWLSTYI